jgi:hypothetical protein
MPVITTFIGTKIAIAAVALAALGGGGAVVAAAAGALPTPASSPTVSASPTESETAEAPDTEDADADEAVGPDVTGPAAFGLCTAYLAGGLAGGSVPSDALIALAGEDGVGDYCELIVANGPTNSAPEEHGKPAETGAPEAPELPEQGSEGVSHQPAERPGQ